jgi:hypothetical protein
MAAIAIEFGATYDFSRPGADIETIHPTASVCIRATSNWKMIDAYESG